VTHPAPVVREVATSRGMARLHVWPSPQPRRRLLLGHGAGGGVQAPDLLALAHALPAAGTEVFLVEQPWRVAGRRVAPAPATLDEVWLQLVADVGRELPLLVGGRSAGARVAARTAQVSGAAGVVALAFPLHPPGKPEKTRVGELDGVGVPVLVVQGANDPFGRPAELAPAAGREVVAVAGDHSLRADVPAVVAAVGAFLSRWP
jgi:uncharacterized protein